MTQGDRDNDARPEVLPARVQQVRTAGGSSVTVREGTASRPHTSVVLHAPQPRHDNIDRFVYYRDKGATGLRVELTQALDRVAISCARLQLMLGEQNESRVALKLSELRELADGVAYARGQPLTLQLRRAITQLAECESLVAQIIAEETGR